MCARPRCWASDPSTGRGEAHALAQPPGQLRRSRHRRRIAHPHGGGPVQVGREPAQRAQEDPQRATLLLHGEQDLRRALGARAGGRQVGAWADHPVGAGEEALHQVARGARTPPCGRPGARTAAPPAGAPPASRRTARWANGRCPRSACASAAARHWPRWARTARARERSRAPPTPAATRSCATRPGAATPSHRAGTAGSGRRRSRSRSPRPRRSRRGPPPRP